MVCCRHRHLWRFFLFFVLGNRVFLQGFKASFFFFLVCFFLLLLHAHTGTCDGLFLSLGVVFFFKDSKMFIPPTPTPLHAQALVTFCFLSFGVVFFFKDSKLFFLFFFSFFFFMHIQALVTFCFLSFGVVFFFKDSKLFCCCCCFSLLRAYAGTCDVLFLSLGVVFFFKDSKMFIFSPSSCTGTCDVLIFVYGSRVFLLKYSKLFIFFPFLIHMQALVTFCFCLWESFFFFFFKDSKIFFFLLHAHVGTCDFIFVFANRVFC